MTGCICRPERGDISGSSTRDTLALVLQSSPAAVAFHSSIVCGPSPGFLSPRPQESVRVDSVLMGGLGSQGVGGVNKVNEE